MRPGFDSLDADDTRHMIKRVMKSMILASGGDEGGCLRDPLKLVCKPHKQVEGRADHVG